MHTRVPHIIASVPSCSSSDASWRGSAIRENDQRYANCFLLCTEQFDVLCVSQLGMVGMEGLWPSADDAPGFQATAQEFMGHCHKVSARLLGCFATGLGLHPDFFSQVHLITTTCQIESQYRGMSKLHSLFPESEVYVCPHGG